MSSKYRQLSQFCYVKVFSTNQHRNLVLLDDHGRVRSQITSVVCQIQRFDFDCNLVVTRNLIIRVPPGLGINPLYAALRTVPLLINEGSFSKAPAPPLFLGDENIFQRQAFWFMRACMLQKSALDLNYHVNYQVCQNLATRYPVLEYY